MPKQKKNYSIPPEDKRPDVMFTIKIPAALRDRIDSYATALSSGQEYVIRSILKQHLDREGIESGKENGRATSAVA